MSKKLMDFSYIGQVKFNPEDGLYYVLEYSTRDIPMTSEFKEKKGINTKENKKWKNKSNPQK